MLSKTSWLWADQVRQLNDKKDAILFSGPREVWHCYFGVNIGHEQNGDESTFLRPAVIMQQFGRHMLWVVPLSTKTPINSQHHHLFEYKGIQYSALVTQQRSIDSRRLARKLYTLDPANYYQIQVRVARMMLREQNRTPV